MATVYLTGYGYGFFVLPFQQKWELIAMVISHFQVLNKRSCRNLNMFREKKKNVWLEK